MEDPPSSFRFRRAAVAAAGLIRYRRGGPGRGLVLRDVRRGRGPVSAGTRGAGAEGMALGSGSGVAAALLVSPTGFNRGSGPAEPPAPSPQEDALLGTNSPLTCSANLLEHGYYSNTNLLVFC